MSAPVALDSSDSETKADKKRKIEEEDEGEERTKDVVKNGDVEKEKTANKKKKMDNFLKFQNYLYNITVFHKEKEVHDISDNIIDEQIESIVNKLGISTSLLNFFCVPRTELLEEVKRIVLIGVHDPLKIIISSMPQQVERLVNLSSNADEDESIMPEVCRLVEVDNIQREEEEKKKKTDSKRPVAAVPTFRKMISRPKHIRYNILNMIAKALRSESLWKNM